MVKAATNLVRQIVLLLVVDSLVDDCSQAKHNREQGRHQQNHKHYCANRNTSLQQTNNEIHADTPTVEVHDPPKLIGMARVYRATDRGMLRNDVKSAASVVRLQHFYYAA